MPEIDKIGVKGVTYELVVTTMSAHSLLFWESNPRIYEKLRRECGNNNITQSDIMNFFVSKVPEFQKLRKAIQTDGMVNEPLFIQKEIDGPSYIVYEGNTRLAAVKNLFQFNELDSDNIKVKILPDNADEAVINSIVGQAHLTGKNDWDAFEKNAFLARTFELEKKPGVAPSTTIKQISDELEVKAGEVKKAIETLSFMKDNCLLTTETAVKQFSYWEIYANNKSLKDLATIFNDPGEFSNLKTTIEKKPFDKFFIDLVNKSDCPMTVVVRENFTALHKSYAGGDKEPLEELLKGNVSIFEARKMVDDAKQDIYKFFDDTYKKLKSKKVKDKDLQEAISNDAKLREKLRFINHYLSVRLSLIDDVVDTIRVADNDRKISKLMIESLSKHFNSISDKTIKRNRIKDYLEHNAQNYTKKDYDELILKTEIPSEILAKIKL